MRILGIMSGTSADGLDCCDVELDIDFNYNLKFEVLKFATIPYSKSEKKFLLSAREGDYKSPYLSTKITELFILKIQTFSKNSNFDIVACHGHTVKHIDKVLSIQLLDQRLLYKKFKVPIIYNFRANDILLSGTGAPLMPFLDWLLFSSLDREVLTLNVGGISNITYIPKGGDREEVVGFDTGPGMSLVDKAVKRIFNEPYDINGKYSQKGEVDIDLLSNLIKNDYVTKLPPKSTDIEEFGDKFLDKIISMNKSLDSCSLIRTLIQFTVDSIHYNIMKFINLGDMDCELVYSGGGTEHPVLVEGLIEKDFNIIPISKYGIDSSIKEALLIALLGACRELNLNSNMRSVTGANSYCVLGDIYNG